MNFKFPHWFISSLCALAVHIFVVMHVLENLNQGTLAEGKHGIEIDLGMLGNLGESADTSLAKIAPVKLKEKPIDKPALSEDVIKETINDMDEVLEIPPALQEIDLVEFEEKQQSKTPPEQNQIKDDTILVDDIVLNDRVSEKQNEVRLETISSDNLTSKNQMKQTTGEADALLNGGQSGFDQSYLAKLLAQLAQHKRYPLSSRKKSEEGVAVLDFEISRMGRVMVSQIQKSSGFDSLDKAVLKMLKRAEPFPPVPPDIKGDPIRFTLPIAFRLNG